MSNKQMKPEARWGWGHLAGALALLSAAVFASLEPWRDIVTYASHDEESSQILLVPIVVAWIVWVRRERLAGCRPVGRLPGLMMVGLGWLVMSMGNRHQIQSMWHGGTVILAAGAVVTVVGQAVCFRLLPALAALAFLVPVPATARHLIAYPLQMVTARATQACAEMLGMSVDRAGNLLSINGTNVAIAEACNGMRMVFTLLMVCYTFAFTTRLSGLVRALVLICSPLVAVACNVVRLVPTIYVYGNYSKERAEMFHDVGGWVMLAVGYLLLMGVVRLVQWVAVPARP